MARASNLRDLAIALSDPQTRKAVVYPRRGHRSNALLADWMSAAIVSTLTDGNVQQNFDNDESIDEQSGRPLLEWYPKGSIIVLAGGPWTHDVIDYYMNRTVGNKEKALVRGVIQPHGQRMRFQYKGEVLADATVPELSKGEYDYGIIQTFEDGEKRRVLILTGFVWQGTWAASLWFRYNATKEGRGAAAVVKWTDKNENGLVELDEVVRIRDL